MRSSFAEFLKDTTDAHQLKLKLLTTTTHSEHKPRIGFITINKACSTKSQSFTREFMFAFHNGKLTPNSWSTSWPSTCGPAVRSEFSIVKCEHELSRERL